MFDISEFGALVELCHESARLAEDDGEFVVVGLIEADEVGRVQVAEVFHQVAPEEIAQAALEQAELFEQEVVGGLAGDRAPMGLDEFEVGEGGGVGDVEQLADVAQGASLLSEFVDYEGALSSSWRDMHGRGLSLYEQVCCIEYSQYVLN